MKVFGIQKQIMKARTLPQEFSQTLESKFFLKDGEPLPKTCEVRFILTNEQGSGTDVVAQKQINLCQHFGDNYATQVYDLDQITPTTEADL